MSTPPDPNPGLLAAIKSAAATVLAMGHTRLELLSNEIETQKLQALRLNPDGLLANLVSFNVGVEVGQILALSAILAAMTLWRRTRAFALMAQGANVLLMLAGFVLAGQQVAGFLLGGAVS